MPLRVVPNSNELQKNDIMFSCLSGTLLTNPDLIITKEKEINKREKRKPKGLIGMDTQTEDIIHVAYFPLCLSELNIFYYLWSKFPN